jgi:hypothetical protein
VLLQLPMVPKLNPVVSASEQRAEPSHSSADEELPTCSAVRSIASAFLQSAELSVEPEEAEEAIGKHRVKQDAGIAGPDEDYWI